MEKYYISHVYKVDIGEPPIASRGWEAFVFNFHDFEKLPSKKGEMVESTRVKFYGSEWSVWLYPGGSSSSGDGHMSLYLNKHGTRTGRISLDCVGLITDLDGNVVEEMQLAKCFEDGKSWGWPDFIERSKIVPHLCRVLKDGTLSIKVLLRQKQISSRSVEPFVKKNTFLENMTGLFEDGKFADVIFVVYSDADEDDVGHHQKIRKAKHGDVKDGVACSNGDASSEDEESEDENHVKAHRLVLQACAPSLGQLCEPYGDMTPVPIRGVDVFIFKLALRYVYGVPILHSEWEKHSQGLVDVADRYGLTDLKLEAETWLVKFTTITAENALEWVYYADAKNCYLMKEAAMDFLVKNPQITLRIISLEKMPESMSVCSDLFAIIAKHVQCNEKENSNSLDEQLKYRMMNVSDLRMKAHEQGFDDIDGSRATLIKYLESRVSQREIT